MAEKIELKYPVEHKGETVEVLTMRRMKVRDQLAADKKGGSNAEVEVTLFSNLCEVAPEVIKDLDIADYRELQKTYKGFLE